MYCWINANDSMHKIMTDDDIKRLALAAGCFTPGASRNYWAITDQMLRRFAELAQEIERNNADNLRQQVEDQAAEIQRLRAALEAPAQEVGELEIERLLDGGVQEVLARVLVSHALSVVRSWGNVVCS